MNKKNLNPNIQQPVERNPIGKQPEVLAELSEAALGHSHLLASGYDTAWFVLPSTCSYDGDD